MWRLMCVLFAVYGTHVAYGLAQGKLIDLVNKIVDNAGPLSTKVAFRISTCKLAID